MRPAKKTGKTGRAPAAKGPASRTRTRARTPAKPQVKPRAKTLVKPRARPARLKGAFKAKDLARFRRLLEEERERLRQELEEIEARAARALETEAAGELSGYDEHPADMASETFEREKDLAIGENIASLLAKMQNALAKIDRGTYGVCDICERPIKRARLAAIPFATLCVECQGRVEAG